MDGHAKALHSHETAALAAAHVITPSQAQNLNEVPALLPVTACRRLLPPARITYLST